MLRPGGEAAQALAGGLGRHLDAEQVSLESLPNGLARLFGWLERIGDHVDITALRALYPEVDWLSFERWVRRQDWRPLTRPGGAA